MFQVILDLIIPSWMWGGCGARAALWLVGSPYDAIPHFPRLHTSFMIPNRFCALHGWGHWLLCTLVSAYLRKLLGSSAVNGITTCRACPIRQHYFTLHFTGCPRPPLGSTVCTSELHCPIEGEGMSTCREHVTHHPSWFATSHTFSTLSWTVTGATQYRCRWLLLVSQTESNTFLRFTLL